jgi:hypothetical protein
MELLILWLYWLFHKKSNVVEEYNPNKEWIVNISTNGKIETIFVKESTEKEVRSNILAIKLYSKIISVYPL